MTIVRVKGFQIFTDRHGRLRCYHRKTRQPVDIAKAPIGTPEFFAECARISALTTKSEAKPGTLGMLIKLYRAHPAFTDLARRTRSDYQAVFDYLKPIDDTLLTRFDKPLVVRIRDKAAATKGRKFGNDEGKILRSIQLGLRARLHRRQRRGRHQGYPSGCTGREPALG